MRPIAIVDTNVFVAAVDRSSPLRSICAGLLQRPRLPIVVPALCVGEISYLVGSRFGPHIEANVLKDMVRFEVIEPEPDDWVRIAELVRRYANFPIGGADASIIALAERLDTDTVITLDRRHFAVVRPRHCERFRLLPLLP